MSGFLRVRERAVGFTVELHAGCFGGRDYTISDIEALIVATGVFQNAGRDGPVVRYDRIK